MNATPNMLHFFNSFIAIRLEAMASTLEAMAIRLDAIDIRLDAIASRLDAIAYTCEIRVSNNFMAQKLVMGSVDCLLEGPCSP